MGSWTSIRELVSQGVTAEILTQLSAWFARYIHLRDVPTDIIYLMAFCSYRYAPLTCCRLPAPPKTYPNNNNFNPTVSIPLILGNGVLFHDIMGAPRGKRVCENSEDSQNRAYI